MRVSGITRQCILFVFLLGTCTEATAADIWFENNVLGDVVTPEIMKDTFLHPESFERASRYINVYMVGAPLLIKMHDDFLTNVFAPYLKERNIKLAVDAPAVTLAQTPERIKPRKMEIQLYRRLNALGVRVDYISLQSTLSKSTKKFGGGEYLIARRIEDAISYAKEVHTIFPNAEIGLIDALPTQGKDYEEPYRMLKEAMENAGEKLSYIHLDAPFDFPYERHKGVTWNTLRGVERYVEDSLGLRFGIITTSNVGGKKSSKEFHERVVASMECYLLHGGTPSEFVIASWFPYPNRVTPDSPVGDDYPAMSTVYELGTRLKKYEREPIRARSHTEIACTVN